MTKNTKALFLSALAFPGFGQFYLKRYKSAGFIIVVALFSSIYLLTTITTIVSEVAGKIITGEISPEYSVIRQTIFDEQANSGSGIMTILVYVLITTWIVSVVDILRLKNK